MLLLGRSSCFLISELLSLDGIISLSTKPDYLSIPLSPPLVPWVAALPHDKSDQTYPQVRWWSAAGRRHFHSLFQIYVLMTHLVYTSLQQHLLMPLSRRIKNK